MPRPSRGARGAHKKRPRAPPPSSDSSSSPSSSDSDSDDVREPQPAKRRGGALAAVAQAAASKTSAAGGSRRAAFKGRGSASASAPSKGSASASKAASKRKTAAKAVAKTKAAPKRPLSSSGSSSDSSDSSSDDDEPATQPQPTPPRAKQPTPPRAKQPTPPRAKRPKTAAPPRRTPGQPDQTWGSPLPHHKLGKFSEAENEALRRCLHAHAAAEGVDVESLVGPEARRGGRGRGQHFVAVAALFEQTCAPRSLRQLYRRACALLLPEERGAWDAADVARLVDAVAVHGRKWTVIGKMLGRAPMAVRDKYRDTEHASGKAAVGAPRHWRPDEERALVAAVKQALGSDAVRADNVPWVGVVRRMPDRTREQLRAKWRTMMQDLALVRALQESGAEAAAEVRWERLAGPEGLSGPARMAAWRRLSEGCSARAFEDQLDEVEGRLS